MSHGTCGLTDEAWNALTYEERRSLEQSWREPTIFAQIKAEASRRILAAYPLWKQINAALGVYDVTTVATMTTYINAVRLASDQIEARLATDPYLDPATQPDWPE